jgi:succinate dehydrogenase flavin-adding protein (antitoxin of CptAB toxin-antitoxin module)
VKLAVSKKICLDIVLDCYEALLITRGEKYIESLNSNQCRTFDEFGELEDDIIMEISIQMSKEENEKLHSMILGRRG